MLFFNCNILYGAPITELFWALLGLLSCKSDSWRRCTCTNFLLVYEGEVRGGVSSAWRHVRTALRFALWDLWYKGSVYGALS